MTTKVITPAEVTMDMLIAGIECNETYDGNPARYKLLLSGEEEEDIPIGTKVRYEVYCKGEWVHIVDISIGDVLNYMIADSYANTIWTTTVEQETA